MTHQGDLDLQNLFDKLGVYGGCRVPSESRKDNDLTADQIRKAIGTARRSAEGAGVGWVGAEQRAEERSSQAIGAIGLLRVMGVCEQGLPLQSLGLPG